MSLCRRDDKGSIIRFAGLDPLDRALRTERIKLQEKGEEKAKTTEEDYFENVRRLLDDHLHTMIDTGLAFEHAFQGKKLGFKILIARYGERGRQFVEVDEVLPHCEIARKLKPRDELIAINGDLVVEPTQDSFEAIKSKILEAPRPLRLTFIEGEMHADEHDLEDIIFALARESEDHLAKALGAFAKAKSAFDEERQDDLAAAATQVQEAAALARDVADKVQLKVESADVTNDAKPAVALTSDNATAAEDRAAEASRLLEDLKAAAAAPKNGDDERKPDPPAQVEVPAKEEEKEEAVPEAAPQPAGRIKPILAAGAAGALFVYLLYAQFLA